MAGVVVVVVTYISVCHQASSKHSQGAQTQYERVYRNKCLEDKRSADATLDCVGKVRDQPYSHQVGCNDRCHYSKVRQEGHWKKRDQRDIRERERETNV